MDQNKDDMGLLGELACLFLFVGLIWMMVPGTVSMTDGSLSVTPDNIPLYLFGIGVIGMILLSIRSAFGGN